MQNLASKIYKALEIPKIDEALSKNVDTVKLYMYNKYVNKILGGKKYEKHGKIFN